MEVKEAIGKRRSYRALGPADISDGLMAELAEAARLMPSCYNNQPWRFVFARSPEALARLHAALSKNNDWARRAPLIIAAFARKDNDCVIKEREYYLFDLGLAVSAMMLRATDLGLVAHPIAGYDPEAARTALGIPEGNMVMALLIVGKKSEDLSALTAWQAEAEPERPQRLGPGNIYSVDAYSEKLSVKVER